MKHERTHALWRSTAQCVFGSIASVLLTLVCFRFHTDTMTAGFLYLIVIVLTSHKGGYVPSLLVSILSFLCLDFFFIPPLFRFTIDDRTDIVAWVAFLITALVISRLVSKERRSFQQVQEAKAELHAQANLLKLTHDAIFVRDMNNLITYWNRAAEELYGWTAEEVVGKASKHQLLKPVLPAPLDEIEAELRRSNRWEGELTHTKRDGTRIVLASRWSLQRDQRGAPVAVLETHNDITERKKAEEALRRSHDELEMKVKERTAELGKTNADLQSVNKELEAFAYSVSHDLRAPVRHIAGFTELLQKHAGTVLDDKSRHHISMILDSAKRMGALVDDLLAFSRIGRAEARETTVHLEPLIKGVVADIAPDAQGRNIEWRIATLPVCRGDPAMLRLVFANLVSNAVKFTRTRAQTQVEIGLLNHNSDEVVVFVKDNGVGFDMKYENKLFGVFQRLHSQEAFEGTGIGLATVQRIVHRHGGRVWAEGSIENGATFYVALPNKRKANI